MVAGKEDVPDCYNNNLARPAFSLSNWHSVRDQGLTRHENWWPRIYRQACAAWGEPPDPKVLAFAETYEGQRADLKTVTGSA